MRVPVALRRAFRLLNHGPTTLVSAAHGGRSNVMAATWVMAIDFEPPKLTAVIAKDTFTRELMERSGEFVINIPCRAQVDLVYALGTTSGREGDKIARFAVPTAPASLVQAPLVEGCVAWLECKVLPEAHVQGAYDLFVAEVVAAWADDEVFIEGEWRFGDDARRTVHHLAHGVFFTTGERIQARRPE